MTVDIYDSRNTALQEKIIRVVHSSIKFAIVREIVDNFTVEVELQTKEAVTETTRWVKDTIKLVYLRYKDDEARMEKLYIALAQRYPQSDIKVSEFFIDGCGTTTYFNTSRPSHVVTI